MMAGMGCACSYSVAARGTTSIRASGPMTTSTRSPVTPSRACASCPGSGALGSPEPAAPASALFHTVILAEIPRMGPDSRDKAARFVTMIDTFYERKVKFICSAAAPPDRLYVDGDGTFEFQRTVSRLMEMQSPEYLALDHIEAG